MKMNWGGLQLTFFFFTRLFTLIYRQSSHILLHNCSDGHCGNGRCGDTEIYNKHILVHNFIQKNNIVYFDKNQN